MTKQDFRAPTDGPGLHQTRDPRSEKSFYQPCRAPIDGNPLQAGMSVFEKWRFVIDARPADEPHPLLAGLLVAAISMLLPFAMVVLGDLI